MDSRETCSPKDNEKMDANIVWQWRIMHVKKYSRHPKPFHSSSKMGLDFNVGSNTQEKMDLQLVTNGVILEVCDFAKMVKKSKRHFITNILENNFDLGLKNEKQRIKFTSQILHKVKDLIQKPPKDKHEAFTLFDMSSKTECASSSKNGLNMASIERNTDSFQVDMDDTDGNEHEEVKCSLTPSKENIKTEEMDGPCADDSDDEDEFDCSGAQSTKELGEDVLPPLYPCCKEIGLNLDVGSNQSLDPGLLTKGVMLELAHFTRVLTGSYRSIVLDVLEHNFELDLNSQQGKGQVWSKIVDLLKRRERLITEFKSELFSFQTNPIKRQSASTTVRAPQHQFNEVTKRMKSDLKSKKSKRAPLRTSDRISKRRRLEQSENHKKTQSHHTDLCSGQTAEDDPCYMCPIDSDEVTDSENVESEDDLQNPTTANDSSSLLVVNSNVKSLFSRQPVVRLTQIPRNVSNKCKMEQEQIETKSDVWKLRAKRGKQILSQLDTNYYPSFRCKNIGLEFDVGFGPKQHFSGDSLGSFVLLKVAKFALAMNSSQQEFIMEILNYNFDFGWWTKKQRKAFPCQVMKRVRQLQNSEDAVKLSKEIFELSCPMSPLYRLSQSMGCINPELSSISETDKCDVAPDSHSETKKHDVDCYPLCKEIGLELHVNHKKPNQNLGIHKLTNGVMTEVINFAEKLCGTFEPICLDILRHNFDLDWLNEESELARNILAQIPVIMEKRNRSTCITSSRKIKQKELDLSVTVEPDSQSNPNLDTCDTGTSQAPIPDKNIESSTDTEQEDELNLWLWKLRTNQINQILSVPHVENCPFYSYSRCKKAGIDFNVGTGVKQNLDPNLLTNGIMVELCTFAAALQSAQKDFITEILEYNFDLGLKDELYRSAFGQHVLSRLRVLLKTFKTPKLRTHFELPDSEWIEAYVDSKSKYCPKCYQDRHYEPRRDECDPGNMLHPRPHAMTDPVSAEARCTAQKPAKDLSSTFQAIEEAVMDSYPCCKSIGLSLFVDKDQPKDKLSTDVLRCIVMKDVDSFTKRLCGKKSKIINDIVEHNFNFGMPRHEMNPALQFSRVVAVPNEELNWFSEVFVLKPCPPTEPVTKLRWASAEQLSEWREAMTKRRQALQTKKVKAMLARDHMDSIKPTKNNEQSSENCYPICTEIGLDLDVASKSGDKKKLDLDLLTRGAVMEIYKHAVKQVSYFPDTVYEILAYNFDLSSQHHRRWEFSLAIASRVKALAKQHQRTIHRADEVFKLPFVIERRLSKRQMKKTATSPTKADKTTEGESTVVGQVGCHSDANSVCFLYDGFWFDEEDTKPQADLEPIMQLTGSPASGDYASFLHGNMQLKEEVYDPRYGDMKPEPNTDNVKYVVESVPVAFLEHTLISTCPNSESSIIRQSEEQNVQNYIIAQPQESQAYAMVGVCPNTESSVKIGLDIGGVDFVVQGDSAGSQGCPIVTFVQDTQDTESTLIKEEQDVPVGSNHSEVVSNTESDGQ